MNSQQLIDIASSLVGTGKGLLAIDESNSTCDKRFAKLGIPQTTAARRHYRELIITTAGLGEDISGIILYDETIRQQTDNGTSFLDVLRDAGIIPDIKVDTGPQGIGGSPRRENHRGPGRIARPPPRVFQYGGALCQVARRLCHRRAPTEPGLY